MVKRIFMKKCFLFMVGSVCHVKWFTAGGEKCGERFAGDEEVETEVRKWLGQQSKDCYAAVFNAVVEDMSRSKCFFPDSKNITCFTFYNHL
jgi:hypothetical protein